MSKSEPNIVKLNENKRKQLDKEVNRSIKPGECLKYITVFFDESIKLIKESSDFLTSVKKLEGPSYEIENISRLFEEDYVPFSIRWIRHVANVNFINESWQMLRNDELDSLVVMVIPGADFLDIVGNSWTRDNKSFYLSHLLKLASTTALTLIILNLDPELQKLKKRSKRSQQSDVSADSVSSLLLELGRRYDVYVCHVHNMTEASRLVCGYTKGAAERQFKQEQNLKVFISLGPDGGYGTASLAASCRVFENGDGVDRLWQAQLTQFRGVTPDMADAIRALFPSPANMRQHLSTAIGGEKEAIGLIADLEIRRGTEYLSNSRRIGKEIATRIYNFISTTNSNQTVI